MKSTPLFLRSILITALLTNIVSHANAQDVLPVRGFCIAAPRAAELKPFIQFIEEELAPRHVNTLVLRVDYNYEFESHPELRDDDPLSKGDVKDLVDVCRKHSIRVIPQINLLGHQSWAGSIGRLLRAYPEFDETPYVKLPADYKWPNADGLYCKSYCPLHPGVHKIVFDVVDEICDAFDADAFHAGMDEVFYIGHDSCARCSGRDKAELYAGEVSTIRNHLALKNRRLWIWGDRLLDGKTTGLGAWEASMNTTSRAIDLIPKDVMICDWHYDRPEQTPVYFAMKGLSVITCPWKNAESAVAQTQDMVRFRERSMPGSKDRYQGMMQTVWSDSKSFLNEFYDAAGAGKQTQANCFRALFGEINRTK